MFQVATDQVLPDSHSYQILHFWDKGLRLGILEQMEVIRYNNWGLHY